MACPSAEDTAIGFSHNTSLPAWAARIVYSLCMELGSTTYTAWISGLSRMRSKPA